jgi:type II restriction enzyme
MRIHHSFSVEPFSKDKFEYVLEQTLNINSTKAALALKGNRGHDITINGVQFSLKTQADRGIKEHMIWISKFMELGKGQWGDNPKDLEELRDSFIEHMKNYERILTLRTLKKSPRWHYELVEIPKELLQEACNGKLEMMMSSVQMPKPGYCYVTDAIGNTKFQLYFDGGSERKLQVKNLLKKYCIVHATWEFTIPM